MDGIKVRALVCGAQDYKESDKLVTLCSVEEGKISVLLKGCRKPTSKLRFASAPFCFAEYVLVEKGGFYTVTGCTPIEQFTSIGMDIDKFYAGSVILECLRRYTKEGENIAPYVACALQYLKTLGYEEVEEDIVVLGFLVEFLKMSGYELDFSACRVCKTEHSVKRYFSYEQGGLVCNICARGQCEALSAQSWGLLRSLTNKTPLSVLRFEDAVKRESLALLNGYYSYVFGKGLNSLIQYLDISKKC